MRRQYATAVLVIVGVWGLLGFRGPFATAYRIQPGFVVRAEGDDVVATFQSLEGTIRFDSADLASSLFDVKVEAASIETGIDLKNTHVKGKQWLDAENFPAIRFQSESIKARENGFVAFGNLELHGIQQGIELPFLFVDNVFSGEFHILRKDYGIGKPKSRVAPRLHITLRVPVIPAS